MRVAIAGAGAVGRSVAAELLENGHEVLLIDKDPYAIKADQGGEHPDGGVAARRRL
jgi:trk system potassium uptake protein TrkA